MKIDMHCHSKFSHDNYLEPTALIEQALKKELDGVCFTEHFSYSASVDVDYIEVPDGFHVFRGLEISTNHGHVLVYGLKDDSWNRWSRHHFLDIFEVIKSVHDCGGICVAAHPFRGWDSIGEDMLKIDGFDAIETHNGRSPDSENDTAVEFAGEMNLLSIGGSDCHNVGQVGKAWTVFNNPVFTIEAAIEEIRKGNCQGMVLAEDVSKTGE